MAKWTVSNLVVSADIKVKIPLERLVIEFPNVEYNPDQFPGAIWRLEDPPSTMLIFNSGKVIITGSKSFDQARKSVEELRKYLKKINVDTPKDYELVVQNIVINGSFEYSNIDLTKMVLELDFVQYDPEQFPGAIVKYPPIEGNTTFLVFRTGKFVCTGAKSIEDAEAVIKDFEKKIISKYAKK